MSMAFKYLCFQLFCIPLEGSPDADYETVVASPQQPRDTVPAEAPAKKVLHPIETFGEACGLIADVTTDRELREVGLRIAASKFEKNEKAELKALYEQRAKEFRG
jgi:hypothetical protein